MALPPLDHVLSPVPAYGLEVSLETIALFLGQMGRGLPSHIVVVDEQQRPLGAIAVGRLWAISQGVLPLGTTAPLLLADCQAWLETVVPLVVPTGTPEGPDGMVDGMPIGAASPKENRPTLAQIEALAQGPNPLVGVSADGRYRGLIDPAKLLGWLAQGRAQPSHTVAGGQRAWVLELSHALKTPMTTLLGLSTLLLDSRVGSLSDRQFRYVSLMRQAIRKLTGLINLLLDWMRLESGQLSLGLERVYLKPLAEDLLPGFFHAQAEGTPTAWASDFAICVAIADRWVKADPLRLHQSLYYGLSYLMAHGATPAGLVIEPWGPWLALTLWSPIGIVNPGPPLGAAVSPGPKLQLDPQSLEGLGLELARRLSQLQGGELSGFSVPTWGSRITLLLPQVAPAHQPATWLVLLASTNQVVIDQVYGSLRGSPYRLAVAPCCRTLAAMQTRLAPPCTLLHWEGLADAPAGELEQLALVESLAMAGPVVLSPSDTATEGMAKLQTLAVDALAQRLRPTLDHICQAASGPPSFPHGVTLLLLRPTAGGSGALPPVVRAWLQRHHCRLLQVDDLPQADLLSRVWQPEAVILDGEVPVSAAYLQALARHPDLARRPLIAPVPPTETTAAALGLSLVPCPEVLTQPPAQAAVSLMRAIALHRTAREG
ncbi:sensor histidine kinase [Nodosilinea sp. PGN35]|uniref:sensor histidine kinase n=1 Tax=Nodosilinea sp. PGN35 TaxID=3020489 RepID=UPI0023B32AB8|nr:histidine kinase dimerization/phospho-acceptor domain-containing protein [Nodosilinea sp. TSF1-S3]MDF0366942.1 histidine kinase dimerization/phospho-acceptor domain-containing protein [Nodosilinea sp. TSF1-S3]